MTTLTKPMTGADWYDSLTEQDAELYDTIEDMCPEFIKYTAEQCQEFMDELSENGITTAEQFGDAYFWQTDSYHLWQSLLSLSSLNLTVLIASIPCD